MNSSYKSNLLIKRFLKISHFSRFKTLIKTGKWTSVCFILCWSVGFNFDKVKAQETTTTSCADLITPKDSVEVKELLVCIKKVRLENEAQRKAIQIKKRYESSLEMSEVVGARIKSEPPALFIAGSKMYPASVAYTKQILNEDKPQSVAAVKKE